MKNLINPSTHPFFRITLLVLAFLTLIVVNIPDVSAQEKEKPNIVSLDTARPRGPQPLMACSPGQPLRSFTTSDSLAGCDDCSTSATPMGFTIDYFGTDYSEIFINSNGNATFGSGSTTYTPAGMSAVTTPMIAPYFADVDLRGNGIDNVVNYGTGVVGSRAAFFATWQNVGHYNSATNKVNQFQLIIIDRADKGPGDFDLEFNYGQIQWETGNASGGSNGLGGTSAVVGYSDGSGVNYAELTGSLIPGSLLDSNSSTGLTNNGNGGICGQQSYDVRNGTPTAVSFDGVSSQSAIPGQSLISAIFLAMGSVIFVTAWRSKKQQEHEAPH